MKKILVPASVASIIKTEIFSASIEFEKLSEKYKKNLIQGIKNSDLTKYLKKAVKNLKSDVDDTLKAEKLKFSYDILDVYPSEKDVLGYWITFKTKFTAEKEVISFIKSRLVWNKKYSDPSKNIFAFTVGIPV